MEEDSDIINHLGLCFEKKIKSMKGNWVITKRRKDKNLPNAFNTAKNVFNCIFENITVQDLEKRLNKMFGQLTSNISSFPHEKPPLSDDYITRRRQQ